MPLSAVRADKNGQDTLFFALKRIYTLKGRKEGNAMRKLSGLDVPTALILLKFYLFIICCLKLPTKRRYVPHSAIPFAQASSDLTTSYILVYP